jgi:signal peptidase I
MTEDTLNKDIALREKSRLRENVEAILVAILLALFIRTFVVQAFKIPSGSMKDTLLIAIIFWSTSLSTASSCPICKR